MKMNRRTFVKYAGLGTLAAGSLKPASALADFTPLRSDRRLKILILGGTAFLGPAIVRYARSHGHQLTLFTRGKTNVNLFPDVEMLVGDRDGDLEALENRDWDVVIDTSGYLPRLVTDSARLLAGHVQQYIFISSISVFADFSQKGLDESSPVGVMEDETIEEITGLTYGPLKALCEKAAEREMRGRSTTIRPGLIVGPMDRTDRFTYWPVRIAKGGEVLTPERPDIFTQVIDVNDLAMFIVHCAERNITGTFNATSPAGELTMGEIFDTCRKVSGSDATFTYVSREFMVEKELQEWSDIPVYVPLDGADAGHPFINVKKALQQGLTFRPISETIRDTLDWWASVSQERKDRPMRSGLTAERELEALKAWHDKNG